MDFGRDIFQAARVELNRAIAHQRTQAERCRSAARTGDDDEDDHNGGFDDSKRRDSTSHHHGTASIKSNHGAAGGTSSLHNRARKTSVHNPATGAAGGGASSTFSSSTVATSSGLAGLPGLQAAEPMSPSLSYAHRRKQSVVALEADLSELKRTMHQENMATKRKGSMCDDGDIIAPRLQFMRKQSVTQTNTVLPVLLETNQGHININSNIHHSGSSNRSQSPVLSQRARLALSTSGIAPLTSIPTISGSTAAVGVTGHSQDVTSPAQPRSTAQSSFMAPRGLGTSRSQSLFVPPSDTKQAVAGDAAASAHPIGGRRSRGQSVFSSGTGAHATSSTTITLTPAAAARIDRLTRRIGIGDHRSHLNDQKKAPGDQKKVSNPMVVTVEDTSVTADRSTAATGATTGLAQGASSVVDASLTATSWSAHAADELKVKLWSPEPVNVTGLPHEVNAITAINQDDGDKKHETHDPHHLSAPFLSMRSSTPAGSSHVSCMSQPSMCDQQADDPKDWDTLSDSAVDWAGWQQVRENVHVAKQR